MTLERPSSKRQTDADLDARHAAHLRALNLDRVLRFAMNRASPFTRTEVVATREGRARLRDRLREQTA